MKDEFYFPSKDGNTEIHTIEWKPEGEVKAVLQLSHGMVEYINRYDEFADFLCSKGYYVVGNDHLGHGKSIQGKTEYGYFNEKYGNACVLGTCIRCVRRLQRSTPGFRIPAGAQYGINPLCASTSKCMVTPDGCDYHWSGRG